MTTIDDAALLRKFNSIGKSKQVVIDSTKTYTEEDLIGLLKQLPDGSRFPLSMAMYEKYNIPVPEIMTFKEALQSSYRVMFSDTAVEIREASEGGVREIPTSQIADDNQLCSSPETLSFPTEETSKENQPVSDPPS